MPRDTNEVKKAPFIADYPLRGRIGTSQEFEAWNQQDAGQRTGKDKSWFT
jgi:hypothetical protein